MQQNTCPSLTKDGQFTSLGPWALTSCSLLLGGSLRKDVPGWEKAEKKFTATSGLPACTCVCVCVCVCVSVCVSVPQPGATHSCCPTSILVYVEFCQSHFCIIT